MSKETVRIVIDVPKAVAGRVDTIKENRGHRHRTPVIVEAINHYYDKLSKDKN
jgi:metal-responsive CopG/Arc/MetJ family transcriptional regulator